jgi:hypothetical protein
MHGTHNVKCMYCCVRN